MFGDVGQPNLIYAGCFEVVSSAAMVVNCGDEIIVNWWAGPAGLALLFGMGGLDASDPAKPVNPVLRTNDPFMIELIGEEAVTESWVICVELNQLVDHLGVSLSRFETGLLSHL